ncbi:MAG: hypothetical protein ABMB14_14340 [Myxococcota bacterium]
MTRLQLPLVQRTFRRGLVQWLDAIGRYRSLLADTDDDPAQAAVHRLASGLAGVASTYAVEGLERAARQVIVAPTVRELATRLDELCDAIRREMHPPVERQRRAVVVASADPAVVSRVVAAAPSHLHRVEAFDTIEDARGFVGRTPVGLVVVDLDLDGDPLGWVATLRDDAGTAELPILAVATEGWLRPDALSLGASEFVKRPFASGAVEDAVGGHLGAGAAARAIPPPGCPAPRRSRRRTATSRSATTAATGASRWWRGGTGGSSPRRIPAGPTTPPGRSGRRWSSGSRSRASSPGWTRTRSAC